MSKKQKEIPDWTKGKIQPQHIQGKYLIFLYMSTHQIIQGQWVGLFCCHTTITHPVPFKILTFQECKIKIICLNNFGILLHNLYISIFIFWWLNKMCGLFSGNNFKNEIQCLETAIFRHASSGKSPVYNPDKFYQFCARENAGNVFNFILSTMI